jgi:hypothetical protein
LNPDLRQLISTREEAGLQPLLDALNGSYLPAVVARYNSEYSSRYFGRPVSEPVPTHPLALSSFRSRLGGLIEYGLAVTADEILQEDYREELRLSFAVASEYPDFYVRDENGERLLRIDCKVLHDESAEYSARFDLPVGEIREHDDLLLYAAWRWTKSATGSAELVYPEVIDILVVPGIEIAAERDRRTELAGGTIGEDGKPYVPRRDGSGHSIDSNYGKIDRIVHSSRRSAEDLSPNIRAYLEFIDRHVLPE